MDIYEYLKADHEKVNDLFKQFKHSPSKRKADIAARLADEILSHAKSEQDIFYTALEKHSKGDGKVLHGRKEHKEIEQQINVFDHRALEENELSTQIAKLEELVTHHVKEEESTLFKKAKDVLTLEEGLALKELMHDLKHQWLLKRKRKNQALKNEGQATLP